MATLEIDAGIVAISCKRIEITDDGYGRGLVLVDGKELQGITGIEIDISKGRPTFIRLQLEASQ